MSELYVGLMSGTSMDGIDAALVDFSESSLKILGTREFDYPAQLREQLLEAIAIPLDQEIGNVAELHAATGECFRDAALALLDDAGVSAARVKAIGSHGQTLRHQPDASPPFSLQIGDPQIIADGTGIETIADFRSADIAAGGQGAPLAPYFHDWLFRTTGETRCILNIGGVANVTVLADGEETIGFDTGPGNSLMDIWIRKHRGQAFDEAGEWAAEGDADNELLQEFLAEPYFAFAPPKSTGFEHFNLAWIEGHDIASIAAPDVQATLCRLSAVTIADAISDYAPQTSEVLVCGGGAHNPILLDELASRLPQATVAPTSKAGLDPDWVEAVAFAWLAMRHMHGQPGNLPSVTGAKEAVVLGSICRSD
ncbi:MAG: anhydro-N-acetylmuramic acid kinase [Woeseiaceae bacterium]